MNDAKRGQYIAAAIQELQPLGFNIIGALVQADVETGRFRKIVGWNNYWGIKAPRNWTGKTVKCLTEEHFYDLPTLAPFLNRHGKDVESATYDEKKKRIVVKANLDFADWYRDRLALQWYAGLVKRLYPNAWAARGGADPTKFFEGLVNGKYQWATDRDYVKTLVERWELYYKGKPL